MRRISGVELSDLTGKTWRTVKGRLERAGVQVIERRGVADLYDSELALAAIYAEPAKTENLDLTAERARLASAQANKTELEVSELRAHLVRREEVTQHWAAMVGAMRAKLLTLPSKLAPQVAPPGQARATEQLLRETIHEALMEISSDEFPRHIRERIVLSAEGGSPTTGPAAEPVGGSVPLPEQRKQRRAGKVAD